MNYKRIISAAMCLCITAASASSFTAIADGSILMGDANGDGRFNATDIVSMQKWLIGKGSMTAFESVDFCADGIINSLDYSLMLKALRESGEEYTLPYSAKSVNLSDEYTASAVTGKEADDTFINAQTSFYLELMQETVAAEDEGTNVLVSPYSVMQALAMTANGARNTTLSEMEEVLGGIGIDTLNEYLCTQRTSQPDEDYCRLNTANSIWTIDDEERIQVVPEFIQKNKDYFNADIFTSPFDDTTVNDINSWASDKTDGMIDEVINEIPAEAVMYLINAVMFDAKWAEQYDEYSVRSRDFTAYDGTIQQADMMYSDEDYYLTDDNAIGVYKHYEGRRYAFAAIMPDEDISLYDYLEELTPERLNTILANPVSGAVNAGIPKFSYEYETDEMGDTLYDMGMHTAFSETMADFYNMAICPEGPIHIGRVIHKTCIDLCEAGTKAAAVTAVEMDAECAPVEPVSVILDRPFLYCIVDTETDLPVFIGTLMSVPQ